MMQPFRKYLSPKVPFIWNDELQSCFEASKNAIIEAIKHGIRICDPKRVTCLSIDWCYRGIGYYLFQKHWDYHSKLPDCSDDKWQVTLAGSRFLMGPKERYATIEGKALGLVWALEQTKYFTLGCENLTVATNHELLFGIFNDKELRNISNPRIFRLK